MGGDLLLQVGTVEAGAGPGGERSGRGLLGSEGPVGG